jgi:hypothetical protein
MHMQWFPRERAGWGRRRGVQSSNGDVGFACEAGCGVQARVKENANVLAEVGVGWVAPRHVGAVSRRGDERWVDVEGRRGAHVVRALRVVAECRRVVSTVNVCLFVLKVLKPHCLSLRVVGKYLWSAVAGRFDQLELFSGYDTHTTACAEEWRVGRREQLFTPCSALLWALAWCNFDPPPPPSRLQARVPRSAWERGPGPQGVRLSCVPRVHQPGRSGGGSPVPETCP